MRDVALLSFPMTSCQADYIYKRSIKYQLGVNLSIPQRKERNVHQTECQKVELSLGKLRASSEMSIYNLYV